MRKATMMVIGILVAGMVVGAAGVSWGVPKLINIQGRLTDSGGAPVTILTPVVFSLYTTEMGGTSIWSTTLDITPDDNGIFNKILGTVTPLGEEFMDDDYYLGITVGLDPEMTPRQRLVSVPFAITAKNMSGDGTINISRDSGRAIRGYVKTGGEPAIVGQHGQLLGSFLPPPPNATGILGHQDSYGVYGWSADSPSIYGIKNDDDDNDANPAIYGKNEETNAGDNPGVKGESEKGVGVLGVSGALTSPAVYGVNSSSGSGVRGDSTGGFGVAGASDNIGVVGGGKSTTVLAKVGVWGFGKNTGVLGTSASGVGVYGQGVTAAGSFETEQGYGIFASSKYGTSGKAAIYGKGSNSPGVEGVSGSRPGVKGISSSSVGVQGEGYHAGVKGISNTSIYSIGVSGHSNDGIGVFGTSTTSIGVYAKVDSSSSPALCAENEGFGPSFLATNNRGNAIQAVSSNYATIRGTHTGSGNAIIGTANSGRGVYGHALTTGQGVYGLAEDGIGILAATFSSDLTKPALQAYHHNNGAALKISKGTISLPKNEGRRITDTTPLNVTIHEIAGTFQYNIDGSNWITVYNNKVKTSSLIIPLSLSGGSGMRIRNVRAGAFDMYLPAPGGGSTGGLLQIFAFVVFDTHTP